MQGYIREYIKEKSTIDESSLIIQEEFINYLYAKGRIRINEVSIPSQSYMDVIFEVLICRDTNFINIVESASIEGYGYLKNRHGAICFDVLKFIVDMKEFMKIKEFILNKEEK